MRVAEQQDSVMALPLPWRTQDSTEWPDFFDKEVCDACIKDMDWMYENKKEFVHKSEYADHRIFGAEELSENINKFNNYNEKENFNYIPFWTIHYFEFSSNILVIFIGSFVTDILPDLTN